MIRLNPTNHDGLRRWLLLTLMVVMCGFKASAQNQDIQVDIPEVGMNFWYLWNGSEYVAVTNDNRKVSKETTFGTTYKVPGTDLGFIFTLVLQKGQIKTSAIDLSSDRVGNSISVKAPDGYVITSLTLNFDPGKRTATSEEMIPPSSGSATLSGSIYTWTGSLNTVAIGVNTTAERQIESVSFTYRRRTSNTHFKPWAAILSVRSGTYNDSTQLYGIRITNPQDGVEYWFRKSDGEFNNNFLWTGDATTDAERGWFQYDATTGINIHRTQYLYVVAVNSATKTDTTYSSEHYILSNLPKAPVPTFSIKKNTVANGGTYSDQGTQTISLAASDRDLGIFYYISDKADNPSISDSDLWTTYSQPLTVSKSSYIYAYADGDGFISSDVAHIYVDILESTNNDPEIKWLDSNGNTVKQHDVTMGQEPYNFPQLSNPHGLPVYYSITGFDPSRVATINSINGQIAIVGSGTVEVVATFTATNKTFYSKTVKYELNVKSTDTEQSMTFYSGDIENNTLRKLVGTDGSDQDAIEVPDGAVIKMKRGGGYPNNYLIMAKVGTEKRDGYPAYELKKNGKLNNFEEVNSKGYTTKGNFQYVDNGIPVYSTDEKNSEMFIQVRIYNPENRKKAVAQYFLPLRVKSGNARPDPPKVFPTTYGDKGQDHYIMTLSEASSVVGEDSATIFAKYSSKATYTPRTLLAEQNLSVGRAKVGVYSTELSPDRRTTAVQVRHNCDWGGKLWDIVSAPTVVYYIYTPNRHKVRLESVNNPVRRDINGVSGGIQLNVNCYIDDVKTDVSDVRKDNSSFQYTFTSSNQDIATVDSKGKVTVKKAGSVIITVTTPKIEGKLKQVHDDEYTGTRGYEAASTSFTIFITDTVNHVLMPPTFVPATNRAYHAQFNASIVANTLTPGSDSLNVGDAYYILVDDNIIDNSKYDMTDFANLRRMIVEFVNMTPEQKIEQQKNQGLRFVRGSGKVAVNRSGSATVPMTHVDGSLMENDETYSIYAVTYNAKNTKNPYSDVAMVTYSCQPLNVDDPILDPGIRAPKIFSNDSVYTFVPEDSLFITASTTTPLAEIYYTVNSLSPDVNMSTGHLYIGSEGIRIGQSAIIRAVAYLDGIYSNVVTYIYRKGTPTIEPVFYYGSSDGNRYVEERDRVVGTDSVTLQMHAMADMNGDGQSEDYFKDKATHDSYPTLTIYYTTDGTLPTSHSYVYDIENPPTFESSVLVRTFCKDRLLGASSPWSEIYVHIKRGVEVWKADSTTYSGDSIIYQTCYSDGTLKDNIISRSVDNANTATAPHDITITIGRNGQSWGPANVSEAYKGNRIDNYGTLNIIATNKKGSTITDADDELGVLYNHAYAQPNDYSEEYKSSHSSATVKSRAYGVYESTFKLPAHGTFVKFEPEKDGEVYIWCVQNGGMHYSNSAQADGGFYNQFLRKRPAYFVDEMGRSVEARSIDASGMLNPRWSEIDRNTLLGLNGMEDGLVQNLFTKAEAQDLYDLYEEAITNYQSKNSLSSTNLNIDIRHLIARLNDGSHQVAASAGVDMKDERGSEDDVIDGTGYCLPSASYMKYAFPVRAGKTYFFFAVKTKVGISALGFKVTEDSLQRQSVSIDGSAAPIQNAIRNTYGSDYTYTRMVGKEKTAEVTLQRNFTAGRWAALVLPFSMSATQVERTFGNGTLIQHYYGFDKGSNISYISLAQHDHQMIVAGTPVFIKPTLSSDNITVDGVQIDKNGGVEDIPDQRWGTDIKMTGTFTDVNSGIHQYDFYVQNGQLVQRLASSSFMPKATRGWITGFKTQSAAKIAFRGASIPTGIETVSAETATRHTDDNIYNLAGMVVGRGKKDLDTLPHGIYIYRGKKVSR